MCQEIYHMMRTMNQDGLEFQLALQCAPLITGIKISNLLMVCGKREDAVQELLEGSDISCFCVMSSPKKTAFLLYREEELKQYLGRTDVRHLLKKLGYKDSSLDNVLPKFRKRYEAHMNGEQQFPHEMGLLLGYPIEDVVGFMEHSGKEYLYSGYWKVYENVSAKKQIFVRYDEARETLIRLLANDIGIRLICEIYKKDTTSHYVETDPFVADVESICGGKTIGLFGSYGWGDGQWMRDWEDRMRGAGATISGGEGVICQETPDADALAACEALGKALAAV